MNARQVRSGRLLSPYAIAIAAAALVALAFAVPASTVGWRDRGYVGMHLEPGTSLVRSVDAGSPAAAAGLRAGDRIEPASFTPREHAALAGPRPGFVFRFDVAGANGERRAIAFVATRRPSAYSFGRALLVVTEIASFATFVVLGALLAILRPGPMTFWLFVFGICTAPLDAVGPFYANVAPQAIAVAVSVATHALFGGWSVLPLLPFVIRFPTGGITTAWGRLADRVGFAAIALGAPYYLALAVYDVTNFDRVARVADDLPALAAFAAAFAIVIAGLAACDGIARQRLRYAVVGMTFGFVAFVTDYIPGLDPHVDPLANTFAVVMPLALAYAVFKQRLIDVRVFVSRAAVYATSAALLVVAIGLLEWGIGEVVGETHVATYLTAAASIVVGLLFDRLHVRSEALIESIVFRERARAESRLGIITRGLRFAETLRAVDVALTNEPFRALGLASADLYRLDDADGRYVAVATAGAGVAPPASLAHDAEWVRELHSEGATIHVEAGRVAIPMLLGAELLGFAVYAPHADGTEIDAVELRTLEALVRTGGVAMTRIEADAARRLVTDLEGRIASLEAQIAARS